MSQKSAVFPSKDELVENAKPHSYIVGPPFSKSRSVGEDNSNLSMVYDSQITNARIHGVNLNQLITREAHMANGLSESLRNSNKVLIQGGAPVR